MEAEQQAELAALQQERDALETLNTKMSDMEQQAQNQKTPVIPLCDNTGATGVNAT